MIKFNISRFLPLLALGESQPPQQPLQGGGPRRIRAPWVGILAVLLWVMGAIVPAALVPSVQAQSLSPSAPNAQVYLIEPQDGATVPATFAVKFGLVGMGIAPSGVDVANTGHHHLLVDTALPDLTSPLPSTNGVLHFGSGQTETSLTLEPGSHTLQLVLGNYLHISHDPPVISQPVTVTVR
jgi:hypothetical protein